VVKARAVLGSGVILNRSTPVYDLVKEQVIAAGDGQPLIIPSDAVVIAGARAVRRGVGAEWGISLYTPVIVKYRDEKTGDRVRLEDYLR
jgi:2,3,4,5-tetrahydropyridine-2-carboxylate N-succinyltransferase